MRLYDDNVPPEQSLPAATQLETPSAPVYTIYYNKIQKTQVLKTSTIAGIEHLHVGICNPKTMDIIVVPIPAKFVYQNSEDLMKNESIDVYSMLNN
ncbi:MAG: hypothetical protein IPI59_15505 [Sphingobacteriales bacterium]|jgi:hypothetical protein|nr:hypothetical protein [Sphingobacteriales bacterium]MBP9141693.1 hypothetical protein [Chitinophagales bacterium]MDA0198488.1 hypothetical protein [Bacteroidota bacterium]MBK6888589.1 hypothetical protein [Sphingobacteriales bacterium]MBK7528903.1 hypothetical protein [Sphingobacteriales bacterium]